MHNTPLLDNIPALATPVAVPEIVTRHKARERAFEKADQWVMARYRQVVLEVGAVNETFGAWDATARYERVHGELSETNRKALGQMFSNLLAEKVIVEAGVGRRPNGNLGPQYSLVK